jgi:hypothetical protein
MTTDKEVFDILEFEKGGLKVIGSYKNPDIRYPSDVDLQEVVVTDLPPQEIQRRFAQKFRKAYHSGYMYITDFKAGVWRGNQPLRWDKRTIKEGTQAMDGQTFFFASTLDQKTIIKMDIIAEMENGLFKEYSVNYYFIFPKNKSSTYYKLSKDDIIEDLKNDVRTLSEEGKKMKSLKREFQVARLECNNKSEKEILDILNSPLGLLHQQMSRLDTLLVLLENKSEFRRVPFYDIFLNLEDIRKKLPNNLKYILDLSDNHIENSRRKKERLIKFVGEAREKMHEIINQILLGYY